MASFINIPTPTTIVRRASTVVPRASTTDRAPSTAARPTQEKSDSNIRPFYQSHGENADSAPWVTVARNFTAKIIDSWVASTPAEDEIDAVSAQILAEAVESELELELSPSSKQQKESVYGMWSDWDRY